MTVMSGAEIKGESTPVRSERHAKTVSGRNLAYGNGQSEASTVDRSFYFPFVYSLG